MMPFFSNILKKPFEADFDIEYCTANRIFRNDTPNVQGKVTIKALKQINKVVEIDVGFKGLVHNYFKQVYVTYSFTMTGAVTRVKELKDDCVLFDQVDKKEFPKQIDLKENGEPMIRNFNFCFPSTMELPSSCDKLGGDADNQGHTTITYYLYVIIKRSDGVFHSGDLELKFPVLYQGASGAFARDIMKTVKIKSTFESKLKRRIWDSRQKKFTVTPIAKARKHTRGIRQLWDANYRKENYGSYAKDVTLYCNFIYCENFNLMRPLNELLWLRFYIPGSKETEGSEKPTLSEDFCVNGKSTGLGRFALKQLNVKLYHDMIIRTEYTRYQPKVLDDLYLVQPPGGNFIMDICDFLYDSKQNVWYKDVSMNEILGKKSSHIPLIDELIRPILCTYTLESFLRIITGLKFTLKVGVNETDTENINSFEAEVPAVVTCFEKLPAYGEEPASDEMTLPPAFSA